MSNNVLKAQVRDNATTKQVRNNGWIPGVVYGKGFDGINIQVEKMELKKFFHASGKVFEVEVKGHGKHLVALEDVQRGHLGTDFVHFSFHKVSANEKTTVTLAIQFVGETKASSEGGVTYPALHEIEVSGLPKDLPDHIEIDVTELAMDSHWAVKDITPPKGCEWAHDAEASIVSCHQPKVVVEVVEETAAVVEPTAEEATSPENEEKEAA